MQNRSEILAQQKKANGLSPSLRQGRHTLLMKFNSDHIPDRDDGSTQPQSHSRPLRRRKCRDLSRAITLRPREVYELYGLPSSTVCELCEHPDLEKRLPSTKIPGRSGHRGMRLIDHAEFRVWLAKWRQAPGGQAA